MFPVSHVNILGGRFTNFNNTTDSQRTIASNNDKVSKTQKNKSSGSFLTKLRRIGNSMAKLVPFERVTSNSSDVKPMEKVGGKYGSGLFSGWKDNSSANVEQKKHSASVIQLAPDYARVHDDISHLNQNTSYDDSHIYSNVWHPNPNSSYDDGQIYENVEFKNQKANSDEHIYENVEYVNQKANYDEHIYEDVECVNQKASYDENIYEDIEPYQVRKQSELMAACKEEKDFPVYAQVNKSNKVRSPQKIMLINDLTANPLFRRLASNNSVENVQADNDNKLGLHNESNA